MTHIHTFILFLELWSSSELGAGCLRRGPRQPLSLSCIDLFVHSEVLPKNTLALLLIILLEYISTCCRPIDYVMTCYRWMSVYNRNYLQDVCTETVDLSSKEETKQKITRPSKARRLTDYFRWQSKTRLSPRSIHECNLHFGEDDLFRFCDDGG